MLPHATDFSDLFAPFPVRRLAQREVVVRAGDIVRQAYYLSSGRVKMYAVSNQGNVTTLHVFHPGAFFPLKQARLGLSSHYFFEALESSVVRVVQQSEIDELLLTRPAFIFDLSLRLLDGLDGISQRVMTLTNASVRLRLISTLHYLARHYGRPTAEGVLIGRFTHQELAEHIGATREATSNAVKSLERNGLLIYGDKRAILLTKLAALEKELRKSL